MCDKLVKIINNHNKNPRGIKFVIGKCGNNCGYITSLKYIFCNRCKNLVCDYCIGKNCCLICANKFVDCYLCGNHIYNNLRICYMCDKIILLYCDFCGFIENCLYKNYHRYCKDCYEKIKN